MDRPRQLLRFSACVLLTALASATACGDEHGDRASPAAAVQPDLAHARAARPDHASALCTPSLPNPPLLNADPTVSGGGGGYAVTTADYNGDGILDLFLETSSLGFSTRLGLGGGAFGPAVSYKGTNDPGVLASADVNGDGHVDVLAADGTVSGLSVFLGKGDGSFRAPTSSGSVTTPTSLATGDFNGDGRVDVALGVQGGVDVLVGNGDGTFAPAVFHATLAGSTSYVVAGDLDGDDHLDLVVASSASGAGGIEILRGVGDGTFLASATVAGTVYPGTVLIGDFNEDGHPDLVATTYDEDPPPQAPGLQVFAGHGDCTFAAPTAPSALPALAGTILAGDFNGDGHLDVADVSGWVILGAGDGTLSAAKVPTHRALELASLAFVVGDFNADGHLDLAGSAGSVLLGKGDGTFPGASTYAAKGGAFAVAFGDLDLDGSMDVVVGDFNVADATVFLGNGKGALSLVRSFDVGKAPGAVALVDVDEDGLLDLIATDESGTSVAVLGGRGDGTFRKAKKWSAGTHPSGLATGDFNGDGHVDLAVTAGSDVEILLGLGTGAFEAPVAYTIYPLAKSVSIGVADFDGDGQLDVLTGSTDRVQVLHGVGDGTFGATTSATLLYTVGTVLHADLNGDGIPDVVALTGTKDYAASLSVLIGNGDGSFQPEVIYTPAYGTVAADLGDVDGDGAPDIMMVGENQIGLLLGNGDGTFEAAVGYAPGIQPFGGGLVDLNGDGKPDVVTTNFQNASANEVTVHLNGGCL